MSRKEKLALIDDKIAKEEWDNEGGQNQSLPNISKDLIKQGLLHPDPQNPFARATPDWPEPKKPLLPTGNQEFIDTGRMESTIYEPNVEVQNEFKEASQQGSTGHQQLPGKPPTSSELSSGNTRSVWEDADMGREINNRETPTPDQNIVEDCGQAMGLTYEDNEPLHLKEKIEERDESRWELDPSSSEDYNERKRQGIQYKEQQLKGPTNTL